MRSWHRYRIAIYKQKFNWFFPEIDFASGRIAMRRYAPSSMQMVIRCSDNRTVVRSNLLPGNRTACNASLSSHIRREGGLSMKKKRFRDCVTITGASGTLLACYYYHARTLAPDIHGIIAVSQAANSVSFLGFILLLDALFIGRMSD